MGCKLAVDNFAADKFVADKFVADKFAADIVAIGKLVGADTIGMRTEAFDDKLGFEA